MKTENSSECSNQEFLPWPLHDAVLSTIRIDWEKKLCTIELAAFIKKKENAVPHEIHWHGVVDVSIPIRDPWGRSVFVNNQRFEDGVFILQMQSGDEIRISAKSVEFLRK